MSRHGNRYAIIGAGNGGCVMAADLALLGRDPGRRLYR
jgi:hypothetical protein